MNYKHAYHAGSFTDVTKHIILYALLKSLLRKDAPFSYIDTHGGAGYYDLLSDYARKTKEYEGGIEKLIHHDRPPPLIKEYLDCVHRINNTLSESTFASLRYYPGSPLLARQLFRARDRMIACELHPDEYQALRATFAGDKQVAIHHTDGFLGLKAFLPPTPRRGLVLIDPPYEDPAEFSRLAHSLPSALQRFETGIFAIWYPIKETKQVNNFYQTVAKQIQKSILVIELTIYPDLPQHLNGSGVLIINPPYQLDATLHECLPWAWKALTINNQGRYHAYFLK